MSRLNLVFLGCGAITAAHSRVLRAFHADVRCFYASRDATRAAWYERRFGGGGSYGSYEAALADGWMDAVFVATPPETHLELTLLALQSGKDVIVEKPAFLLASDYERVRMAQKRSGRRVFVAENYAYKPMAKVLQDVIASGDIGELRFVQITALKLQDAGGWREGSAALLDGGIHWIDLLTHLGPRVERVFGVRAGGGSSIERGTLVVAEYEGGAAGVLSHSWEIPSPLRGLRLSRLHGTAGSVAFESNGLFALVWGRRTRLVLPGLRDIGGYRAMFSDFFEALRTPREPLMTLDRAQEDFEHVQSALKGAEDAGGNDRLPHGRSDRSSCGGAHGDVGDVQGQPLRGLHLAEILPEHRRGDARGSRVGDDAAPRPPAGRAAAVALRLDLRG